MTAQSYGRIVNIASVAGKEGNPKAADYAASKAGVIGFTKALGKEVADKDIAVNCVTPAAANTPILEQMTEEFIEFMLSKIPRGRFVEVEEIANLVVWIASAECSFTTGSVFDISGGGTRGSPPTARRHTDPDHTTRPKCSTPSPVSTVSAKKTPSPFWPAQVRWPPRARTSSTSASASPISRRPTNIVEAAIKALRDGHHGYTPATGILPLREAVAADLHRRYGRRSQPGQRSDRARRQGHDVRRDPDVRRTGRRNPLSRSRLPDLPLDDRVHRRHARSPSRSAKKTASPFPAEETLSLLTPKTRLMILNSPANPCGGVTPKAEVDNLVAGLAELPRHRHHVRRDLRPDAL